MATENTQHAWVVLDGEGTVSVILSGADAPEAAAWYRENGFRVAEVELEVELAAA